jgi:hypothetical protein
MSMLIVAVDGLEALEKFYTQYGLNPNWDIARQAAIAREIVL